MNRAFTLLAVATLGCARTVAVSTDTAPPMSGPESPIRMEGVVIAHSGPVTWGPGPAALPPGARAVILDGNPAERELFTMRLWLPANYMIPPHTHPAWEHVTVISGLMHFGMGAGTPMSQAHELRPGSFIAMRPGTVHFAHAATESVIQVHAMGPWQVNYVNPADDPRRR